MIRISVLNASGSTMAAPTESCKCLWKFPVVIYLGPRLVILKVFIMS